MRENEKITFNDNGTDYEIADHGEGRIFFEFEGNCYGMNYDTVAGLIRGGLELVNAIETEI